MREQRPAPSPQDAETGGPVEPGTGSAVDGRPAAAEPEPRRTHDGRGDGEPLVVVEGLRKVYRTGPREVVALSDVSLTVRPGELVAVRGRSGAGKSTLLNLIGGLDRPDAGRVVVAGREVTSLPEDGLLELRRDVIGFVFQSFGLIPVLSAAENVGVPLRLARVPAAEREERARTLLALVGLEAHADQRPYELSGGQQQRVAIARALANRPRLLIADEPTGQLDSQTGRQIMRLLHALVRDEGVTVIVATHDQALITAADRHYHLHDGRLTPS
ncbi:ABC transporter ATP-binding protein [Thermostaphylospora chromogena]|uniref:Putative ABC transport system ATP-binding protein n=1 Tax=Thermostaphylospora chromogena TaxID=35622 RepID=A0A1H1FMW7_9ACTN|nr:ABC transporter ATP-binding protein [Thermostaphylospora chromogena]SDR02342.1 putative ABC transport system ATP-binding protein [Thermostaphylospora chromogena]